MSPFQLGEQFNDITQKIISEFQRLKDDMSQIDILQQDILHEIEFGCFNVVKGYFYAKKIKDIRQKRRQIKIECEAMQVLYSFVEKNQSDINRIVKKLCTKEKKYNTVELPTIENTDKHLFEHSELEVSSKIQKLLPG